MGLSELDKVNVFCYLGRPLSYNNSDWVALYRNLKKAQAKWGMIARLLVREGASLRARGHFYKAVVQSVLLYGCETWTITATMMKVLDRFHHRVARRISGMVARLVDGEWFYPPLEAAMEAVGLFPMKVYVRKRQATIEQYIATRPILQLCRDTAAAQGTSRSVRWWTQKVGDEEEAEDGALDQVDE